MSVQYVALRDLVALNPPTPKGLLASNEEVAIVPMASVSEQGSMEVREYRPANEVSSGLSYFADGDVLVAKITPCYENNKITRASVDRAHAFGSTEFHVLRPKGGAVDAGYLTHFLRQDAVRDQGQRRMTGSGGQRRVPRSFLESLEIPLPPLDEQRRIAEILDQADALRRKRREALDELHRLTDALFKEMFPSTSRGGDHSRRTFSSLLAEPLRNGVSPSTGGGVEFSVLTLSAITGASFNSNARKVGTFNSPPTQTHRVYKDDFFICRGNGSPDLVGRGLFPTHDMVDTVFPDTIIAGRIDQREVDPAFLQYVWNAPENRQEILKIARTTNGTFKVNQTMLGNLEIVAPVIELQREFGRAVSAIGEERAAAEKHLAHLDTLFASLQHRAFRGEL